MSYSSALARRPLRRSGTRLSQVPRDELTQHRRSISSDSGCGLTKRIPCVFIHGDGALRGSAGSGGHGMTVSAACALPQHLGGRVGCCHEPNLSMVHAHCLGSLRVQCTGSNVTSTKPEHDETPPSSPGSGTGFRLATRLDQGRSLMHSLAVATPKSISTHPTLADPLEIEDLQAEFADVTFELAYVRDDDLCSECPEGSLFGPSSAELVFVYLWWGFSVRVPSGTCCASATLRYLLDSDAVTELRVEVLVAGEEAA